MPACRKHFGAQAHHASLTAAETPQVNAEQRISRESENDFLHSLASRESEHRSTK
jgi:hypothetical protein